MASQAEDEAETPAEQPSPGGELQGGASGASREEAEGGPAVRSDADADATRRVFINLGLLASLGALGSAWILYYTEWFPLVSGVLGLGGLFAWAAFLGGLLSEHRKESLQQAFERFVLTSRGTAVVAPALFGAFLLWASCHGSVVLESKEGRDRLVAVVAQGSAPQQPDRDYLAPHGERKQVVRSGWLGRHYVVKASGLPSALVAVGPLAARRVAVPMQFAERVVLLVHLDPNLSTDAADDGASFVVTRDRRELKKMAPADFHGASVWVGCDPDVEIPDRIVDSWRLLLAQVFEPNQDLGTKDDAKHQEALRSEHEWLNRWRDPVATGDLDFKSLDRAQVAVVFPDGRTYSDSGRPRLRFEESGRKIQLIYLEYPREQAKTGGAGS